MDRYKYLEALDEIKDEIYYCSKDSLDDDGKCICCMYPCWRLIAKEAIQKQLEVL